MKKIKTPEQSKGVLKVVGFIAVVVVVLLGITLYMTTRNSNKSSSARLDTLTYQDQGGRSKKSSSPLYKKGVKEKNQEDLILAEQNEETHIPVLLDDELDVKEERGGGETKGIDRFFGEKEKRTQGEANQYEQEFYEGTISQEYIQKCQDHMKNLKEKWSRLPPQEIAPQVSGGYESQGGLILKTSLVKEKTTTGGPTLSPTTSQGGQKKLIEAGKLCYGELNSAINTDHGSYTILGEMTNCYDLNGNSFNGAILAGGFQRQNEVVAAKFNIMNHSGRGYTINAIALDDETAQGVLRGEVNRHIFVRYILPTITDSIAGLGEVVSRSNTTTSVSSDGTINSQQGELDTADQLKVSIGKGMAGIARKVEQDFSGREKTVTIEKKIPIGILFLSDVVE